MCSGREHCSLQALAPAPQDAADQRRRTSFRGPARTPASSSVGDGLGRRSFKIESHNHPSFIEPYQGAATGVGGILRDVFTMGARPIAMLNSLRFGSFDHPRTRYLVDGVVRGIGDYGNCIGVPTVGGEIDVRPRLRRQNPLVNAMSRRPAERRHDLHRAGRGRRQPGALRRRARPGGTASTVPAWPRTSSSEENEDKRPARAGRRSVH
ncbi:MAG: AIR synthase related protein [Gemmatimonadaceae bacterium]|nr:AIR synthase related protein [Gemmatimonadaceae bacterium]